MLLVISYSQVLSDILVSGDRVLFFVCIFFVYILREVKCKFIIIYRKIKKKKKKKKIQNRAMASFQSEVFHLSPVPISIQKIEKNRLL